MKYLQISGSVKEVELIITRLAEENPGMTVQEYLEKYNQEVMVLK